MRSFLLVASMLIAGCGGGDAKEFEGLADRACQCTENDTACGAKVLADVVKFAEEHGAKHSDQERINAAGVRLSGCLMDTGITQPQLTAALEKM